MRHRAVARHLGPASGWFSRNEFEGRVPVHCGTQLKEVTEADSRVKVRFSDASGSEQVLETDHVIGATGYRPVLHALPFLDKALAAKIRTAQETPDLDRNFCTSVPGLYMVGLASANNFGPVCRFACGADFTTRRLAKHLANA
jgi:thioredoxin reductase